MWTDQDTLTASDLEQLALQLTGHARALAADDQRHAATLPKNDGRGALADGILREAADCLSQPIEEIEQRGQTLLLALADTPRPGRQRGLRAGPSGTWGQKGMWPRMRRPAVPLLPTAFELLLNGLLKRRPSGPGALPPAREPRPRVF
ncbi:hypothetical protein ATE80_29515 [Streptomyces kanasensis]|uniref:DUF222 domain-containing protein n=1 Tax=Streptomyces kanasensis TaxID=936756 RepID=A0A100Y0E2_9ACTN|nr:hypothetical protein ATE80_29515 [Streptomyces kanasensis]